MPAERNVKQYGAVGDGLCDDTAAIQKALEGGGCTVVIPAGSYTISSALSVSSGTTIRADDDAVVRLADGAGVNAGVFVLTNDDPVGGNQDIRVEGGAWDGNCAHNPRGEDGDMDGYTGTAVNFVNVSGLTLCNLTVRNPEGFSIRLGEVQDFRVEDIRFDNTVIRPNQDGVHVGGFSHQGVIRNLHALTPKTTNDDMVALNADDDVERVLNLGMKRGPISDIEVEGLYGDDVYTFVRLLSVDALIEEVSIGEVHGGCRYHAVNMGNWRFPAGVGNIRSVRMRDFTVRKVHGENSRSGTKHPLVTIRLAVEGLQMTNFRRDPADDLPAPTLVVDNGRDNDIEIEGGTVERDGTVLTIPHGGFSTLRMNK